MKLSLVAVVSSYFLHLLKGDIYCSNSTTPINCLPCSKLCDNKNETCANNNLYTCPSNCDNRRKCNYVCCQSCLNDICEYTHDGQVKCAAGCVSGTMGICCGEPCPARCRECDQFNSSCTACNEGLTGINCNETFGALPTSTLSPFQTISCEEQEILLEGTTSAPSGPKYIVTLAAGLGSVFFLIVCISVCYKLTRIYQCYCKKRTSRPNSNQSLSTEHGYNYIDESELDSYYSPLKQQSRVTRFQIKELYHSIEQKDHTNGNDKTNSFHSSSSGSLFGNLFDTSAESEIIQRNIPQDNERSRDHECLSMFEYEKYITPTSP